MYNIKTIIGSLFYQFMNGKLEKWKNGRMEDGRKTLQRLNLESGRVRIIKGNPKTVPEYELVCTFIP
jgi:hypothetical protein